MLAFIHANKCMKLYDYYREAAKDKEAEPNNRCLATFTTTSQPALLSLQSLQRVCLTWFRPVKCNSNSFDSLSSPGSHRSSKFLCVGGAAIRSMCDSFCTALYSTFEPAYMAALTHIPSRFHLNPNLRSGPEMLASRSITSYDIPYII